MIGGSYRVTSVVGFAYLPPNFWRWWGSTNTILSLSETMDVEWWWNSRGTLKPYLLLLNCFEPFALRGDGNPKTFFSHSCITTHVHSYHCLRQYLRHRSDSNQSSGLHCHSSSFCFRFLWTTSENLRCAIGWELILPSKWIFRYQLCSWGISNIKDNKMQCRKNFKNGNVLN